MKQIPAVVLIVASLTIAACAKKDEQTAASEAPPAASEHSAAPSSPQATSTEPAQNDAERAEKQAQLDYATMEDTYINDPRAQWAASAKASSTFGDEDGKQPADSNLAANVAGPVDGKTWTNNQQDIGFDWLEASFAKPVTATEVRVVFRGDDGVEAVSKVELQDTQGKWSTIWSGLSDAKGDSRGNRTWFVRTFDKTANPVNAVKVTIANNVQSGYKVIDAVQLVGD